MVAVADTLVPVTAAKFPPCADTDAVRAVLLTLLRASAPESAAVTSETGIVYETELAPDASTARSRERRAGGAANDMAASKQAVLAMIRDEDGPQRERVGASEMDAERGGARERGGRETTRSRRRRGEGGEGGDGE